MMHTGGGGHLERAVDEGHAVVRAEPQVGQQQIDALGFQQGKRAGNVGGGVHLKIVFLLERTAQSLPGVLLVVNDEEGFAFHAGVGLPPKIPAKRPGPSREFASQAMITGKPKAAPKNTGTAAGSLSPSNRFSGDVLNGLRRRRGEDVT